MGQAASGAPAVGRCLDEIAEAQQVGLEDRADDRSADAIAHRCGKSGGMSVSSQRTMVVVPSAPGSSVMTPPPVNVPSWRIANRVGGSNSVIVDRDR